MSATAWSAYFPPVRDSSRKSKGIATIDNAATYHDHGYQCSVRRPMTSQKIDASTSGPRNESGIPKTHASVKRSSRMRSRR